MKRTQEEILKKIQEVESSDFFGVMSSDLIDYLDFDNAKKFLKDGVTKEEWDAIEKKTPKERMIDYMDFAWDKANDERGLSAARSMQHYEIWLWLDGDEELHKTLEFYTNYGKPQLMEICKYLGLDSSNYE